MNNSNIITNALSSHKSDEVKALPAPDETQAMVEEGTTTVEVDGKVVRLDHFGPVVINQDGTLSRISNWGEMTENERRNTLRVLGKRNQLRLDDLHQKLQTETS